MWAFLRNEQNRQILAWLGGGLVAIASGLWAAFVYLDKSDSGGSFTPADCSVNAEYSVAACGDVSGNNVIGVND